MRPAAPTGALLRLFFLTGCILLAPTAIAASHTPSSKNSAFGIPFFTAHYTLNKFGLAVAHVTVTFTRQKGQLIYREVTKPAGILAVFRHDRITEESRLAPGKQPLPIEYHFIHAGDGPTKEAVVHFNRHTLEATGHMQNGDPVKVSIHPDTLDRLSLQLALMQAIANQRKPLRFTTVETKNKLSHYDFHYLGDTSVVTPLGRLDTIHLQRIWKAKHMHFDFWLAPTLHDLPVKLVRTRAGKGSGLALYLQSVNWH